jgi:hypothetical protein
VKVLPLDVDTSKKLPADGKVAAADGLLGYWLTVTVPVPVLPVAVVPLLVTIAGTFASEVVALIGLIAAAVGVTALDGREATLVPAEFVAFAVNVYAVPFVKPVTVEFVPDGVKPVHAEQAGDEVIVYPVMVAPPAEAGAV